MKPKAKDSQAEVTGPRLRRAYFECRFGQLHVRDAMPAGGGFDEETALLCLHRSAASSRMFQSFLGFMGNDRSIYAPDIPGYGESDPPSTLPSVGDYAAAVTDMLDSLRLRQLDIVGVHSGAAIAVELAHLRPGVVRRLVLAGVPLFDEAERVAFRASPSALAEWGASATMNFPLGERLAALKQRTLVLRPRDELWNASDRARVANPSIRCIDLPDLDVSLFETAPERMATLIREFLTG